MRRLLRTTTLAALVLSIATNARAQTAPSAPTATQDAGWEFTIYPVLAWLPYKVDVDVNVPPINGGGGGSGSILNSQFDGAFLAGFSATNQVWRFDVDGLWAAVRGDRMPQLPNLSVDLDVYYGHGTVGRRLARDLYVTGGLRRIAAKYGITLGNQPTFSRRPGVWDPLVGVGWHREQKHWQWHAVFEGGGFGVGSDADIGTSFRVDWKPTAHFGVTGGYALLYFKISDELAVGRTFVSKQTFQGPIVGVGFYF